MVGEEMNKETDKLIIVVIENFCTVLSTIKDSVSESRTIGRLYPQTGRPICSSTKDLSFVLYTCMDVNMLL